jgi:hypothetical protein
VKNIDSSFDPRFKQSSLAPCSSEIARLSEASVTELEVPARSGEPCPLGTYRPAEISRTADTISIGAAIEFIVKSEAHPNNRHDQTCSP